MSPHSVTTTTARDCTACGSAGSIEFSMCQVCLTEVSSVGTAPAISIETSRDDLVSSSA